MFYFLICAELQVEVTLCVVVADAFHDLLQGLLIAGVLAILDPVADEVAHQAAEQLVAGVAQEATAVGQHADKVAQQPQASRCGARHCWRRVSSGWVKKSGKIWIFGRDWREITRVLPMPPVFAWIITVGQKPTPEHG